MTVERESVSRPVAFSCRKTGYGDEVEAHVAGVAYRCAPAEDRSGTKIVFFVDCGQPSTATA